MACMKNWKVTHSTSCSGEVIALEGTALLALVIVEGALVAVTDDPHATHFCTLYHQAGMAIVRKNQCLECIYAVFLIHNIFTIEHSFTFQNTVIIQRLAVKPFKAPA